MLKKFRDRSRVSESKNSIVQDTIRNVGMSQATVIMILSLLRDF